MKTLDSQIAFRNPWIATARVWLWLVFIFLYLPILVLIVFSFQEARFSSFPLQGWTFGWYQKMYFESNLVAALYKSLVVSPAAATGASIIGFFAAYALNRFVFKGRAILAAFFVLPIIIPTLILGIALLTTLSWFGWSGTTFSVFISHVLLTTAPALAIIQLRLAQMPKSIEEAAWDLGATELQTLLRVVLPFALPGILGGWLLAFTFSFDEFMIAWFVGGFDPTLPVAIFTAIRSIIDPSLNAMGTIVFAISAIVLIGIEVFLMPMFFNRRKS